MKVQHWYLHLFRRYRKKTRGGLPGAEYLCRVSVCTYIHNTYNLPQGTVFAWSITTKCCSVIAIRFCCCCYCSLSGGPPNLPGKTQNYPYRDDYVGRGLVPIPCVRRSIWGRKRVAATLKIAITARVCINNRMNQCKSRLAVEMSVCLAGYLPRPAAILDVGRPFDKAGWLRRELWPVVGGIDGRCPFLSSRSPGLTLRENRRLYSL